MSLTNGLLELPEKMTRSDSVSAMRGLLQRGYGAGLPARGGGGLGGRASARHLAVVLREDDLLHPLARLAVQRVRDVLERAVLAALRRHRDEQTGVAVDHFEVAHDETVVERDRHVGFQPFLVYRKDPHLGDLHDATPLDATPPTEQTAQTVPPARTRCQTAACPPPAKVRGNSRGLSGPCPSTGPRSTHPAPARFRSPGSGARDRGSTH